MEVEITSLEGVEEKPPARIAGILSLIPAVRTDRKAPTRTHDTAHRPERQGEFV